MSDRVLRYERSESDAPTLIPSLVAFVDVLGTSHFATSDEAQNALETLDRSWTAAKRFSGIDDDAGWWHVSWFSDNLALCAPVQPDPAFTEGAIGFPIITLGYFQYRLAIEGMFLRGGMTTGMHYSDERITFGPALVEAVALEHDTVFPRVELSSGVERLLRPHARRHSYDSPFSAELMYEGDSLFISYLSIALEADDEYEALDALERHRDAVRGELEVHSASGRERVLEKYLWVAAYHDAFCNEHFSEMPQLKVGEGLHGLHFRSYDPPR